MQLTSVKKHRSLTTVLKQRHKALKRTTLYDLSICLTVAAKLGYSAAYQMDLAEALSHLDTTEDSSFKAWMLGRLALAAKKMHDLDVASACIVEIVNRLGILTPYRRPILGLTQS